MYKSRLRTMGGSLLGKQCSPTIRFSFLSIDPSFELFGTRKFRPVTAPTLIGILLYPPFFLVFRYQPRRGGGLFPECTFSEPALPLISYSSSWIT